MMASNYGTPGVVQVNWGPLEAANSEMISMAMSLESDGVLPSEEALDGLFLRHSEGLSAGAFSNIKTQIMDEFQGWDGPKLAEVLRRIVTNGTEFARSVT